MNVESKQAVRSMTCAVCGAYCKGRQWHNRDTGYGLCSTCPAWLAKRGMDAEEMERLYGKAGVHYFPEEQAEPAEQEPAGPVTKTPYHVNAIAKNKGISRIVGDETVPGAGIDSYELVGANATVAKVYRGKDAAYLKRAANSHDDLVRALEATLPALTLLGDYIGNTFAGKVGIEAFDRCAIILQVRDALAKATA